MSTGLVPAEWSNAFLAFALVGAVFAVGIAGALNAHLARIVAVPGGVARSSEAVVVALGLALVGLAGSWPADTPARVGIAVAIVAAGTLGVLLATIALGGSGPGMPPRTGLRLGVALAATVPTVLGGLLLALGIVPGLDPMLIGVGASAVGGLWLGAYLLLDLPRA